MLSRFFSFALTITTGAAEPRIESRWLKVQMHRTLPGGEKQTVELLRSERWAQDRGIREGAGFHFETTEQTFSGTFWIDSVAGFRLKNENRFSKDQMVIGRFTTENVLTCALTLRDGTEVRGTCGHPLFSSDRNGWSGLGEMVPGERLRTAGGVAVVQSVVTHQQRETVHNLEVERMHQYFAGRAALLTHNVNGCAPRRGQQVPLLWPKFSGDHSRWISSQRLSSGQQAYAAGRVEDNVLEVGGISAADGPKGVGSDLVAEALKRWPEIRAVRYIAVNNPETVVAFESAKPASESLLGRSGANAISKAGRTPGAARYLEPRRQVFDDVLDDATGFDLQVDVSTIECPSGNRVRCAPSLEFGNLGSGHTTL